MNDRNISSTEAARRERFLAAMHDAGATTAIIANPRHIYYLTGYLPGERSPAFLLVRPDAAPMLVAGAGDARAGDDV